MELNIETLTNWSDPQEVHTKAGPRYLCKSTPDEKFWELWKTNKEALKAAGISISKNRFTNEWEICWWKHLPKEVIEKKQKKIEASRAQDADIEIPAPEGLNYLPFQRAGIAYASKKDRCIIGDDMGVGKTIQAIGLINLHGYQKVLIICPASLRLNWRNELRKWLVNDLSIAVVSGGKEEDWYNCGANKADIVIINFDVVSKHRELIDARGEWDFLCVDEAHNLKNPEAQRTQAIFGSD